VRPSLHTQKKKAPTFVNLSSSSVRYAREPCMPSDNEMTSLCLLEPFHVLSFVVLAISSPFQCPHRNLRLYRVTDAAPLHPTLSVTVPCHARKLARLSPCVLVGLETRADGCFASTPCRAWKDRISGGGVLYGATRDDVMCCSNPLRRRIPHTRSRRWVNAHVVYVESRLCS